MITEIKTAVEIYTGEKLGKAISMIKIVADPLVSGAYAVRAIIKSRNVDFLITGVDSVKKVDMDWVMEHVEECEWEQWPPRSSESNLAQNIFR